MEKTDLYIGTLVLIILLFIFFFAGSMVDKSMNVCLHIDDADYKIRSDVKSFHNTLSIADLHSDLLLWDRSINKRGNNGPY